MPDNHALKQKKRKRKKAVSLIHRDQGFLTKRVSLKNIFFFNLITLVMTGVIAEYARKASIKPH